MPGRSTRTASGRVLIRPSFFSTVTPGQFPTCCRVPVKWLNIDVLPVFGLPTSARVLFIGASRSPSVSCLGFNENLLCFARPDADLITAYSHDDRPSEGNLANHLHDGSRKHAKVEKAFFVGGMDQQLSHFRFFARNAIRQAHGHSLRFLHPAQMITLLIFIVYHFGSIFLKSTHFAGLRSHRQRLTHRAEGPGSQWRIIPSIGGKGEYWTGGHAKSP